MTTQASCSGERVITIRTRMARLLTGVHADAVVVEQSFMGEGTATLFAGQRLLSRVRQHMVLEDGSRIGTPATQVTLLRPGLGQVNFAVLY